MSKIVTTVHLLGFAELPAAFRGLCIVHVSDYHNKAHKENLFERIAAASPDLIAVTGDSIHIEGKTEFALEFFRRAAEIAPVYYVNGNHESVLPCYPAFLDGLRERGVHVLLNEAAVLTRGEDRVVLLGMEDPTFFPVADEYAAQAQTAKRINPGRVSKAERRPAGIGRKASFKKELHRLSGEYPDDFKILLSHRPELYADYFAAGIHLTLTGHAHGGQIKLPLFGPLYAPNQGWRPGFVSGIRSDGGRHVVVSRGLGDSHRFPKRFNNPYELVILQLSKADKAMPY